MRIAPIDSAGLESAISPGVFPSIIDVARRMNFL